ncbi:MAG: transporter [Thermodesulfobacteriota bacterium]
MKTEVSVLIFGAALILCLLSTPLLAQMDEMDNTTGMEGMDMPIVSYGAHVLPQGRWKFKVYWTQMEDDEFRINGSVVHPDMDMRMGRVVNEIYYGLPDDMHLRLVIPYVNNKMNGTTMNMGMNGKTRGFGDIIAILKKRFYSDMVSGWSFAAGLGFKLPTGKSEEKFSDRNKMTQNFYDDYRLPINMQPGTGKFDPVLTSYFTKSDSKGSWHGHLMYINTLEADKGVDPGDKLMFHLARNFPLTDHVILVGEINGMWQGDDDYQERNIPSGLDRHGTIINLTPGLQFKPTDNSMLEAAVKFPVVTPDDGMIPKPMPFIGGHIRF